MEVALQRDEVRASYALRTWQRDVFEDFAARILSSDEPFPCIYGVSGFKANHLRFSFLETIEPAPLAEALRVYLRDAPGSGSNTSLVVFSRPTEEVLEVSAYRLRFWEILRGLAQIDRSPWPQEIPHEIDHADWEFCFAGQPMFVVCNTPAHVNRRSRNAAAFMLTFQPRYVFNGILGTPEAARRATGLVRERLVPYDALPPSPVLGLYGDPDNREYAQYFLEEDNGPRLRCPFRSLQTATPEERPVAHPEEMDA